MLKQVSARIAAEDSEAVKRRAHVEYEYDWSGRGLAMFSNAAEGIWYAYSLAVPVRSGATVARRPYISPLVEVDGLYGKYVVALIDRRGGEFTTFRWVNWWIRLAWKVRTSGTRARGGVHPSTVCAAVPRCRAGTKPHWYSGI